jgi:hypothetical protein
VVYAIVAITSGILGGLIGRHKGSSFVLWGLVSLVIPVLGPLGALLYRSEREELRRQCPTCGKVVPLHDAICTRCGNELDFPEVAIEPESAAR